MITQIKVCNRFAMNNLALIGYPNPQFRKPWHLISIHGDSNRLMTDSVVEKFKSFGMKEWISQEFWDITDDPTMIENLKISFPNYKLFTHRQAQEIVDFIAKRQKEDGNDVLVCHCDAGISRSGAVATFACDYCKLNYTEFIQMNPFLRPNDMVLRMLRDAGGLNRLIDQD